MSICMKEKNLVTFAPDENRGKYVYDINTGVFYGLRGKPLKNSPRATTGLENLLQAMKNTHPDNNFWFVFYYVVGISMDTQRRAKALQGAEKLDALNIPCLEWSMDGYAEINDRLKEFLRFREQNPEAEERDFMRWVAFERAKKKYGSALDGATPEIYLWLKDYRSDLTVEEMGVCIHNLTKGKIWEYYGGLDYRIVEYITYCRFLNKKPEKTNNFVREFCETRRLYNLRKTEFDNSKIVCNYAKQSKAWQFEYGDFVVVIPTSGQDIVTEGEKMHHCVGQYVNKVVENRDYICFVRRKNNTKKPYITCEVKPNGRIGQYFLAYDERISSAEDKEFRSAFQQYLDEVWVREN